MELLRSGHVSRKSIADGIAPAKDLLARSATLDVLYTCHRCPACPFGVTHVLAYAPTFGKQSALLAASGMRWSISTLRWIQNTPDAGIGEV